MLKSVLIAMIGLSVIWISGCSVEPDPLTVPVVYDSTQYQTNSSVEKGLLGDMQTLATIMKTGRTAGKTVSIDALQGAYAPIRSFTGSYYTSYVDEYLATLSRVSGKSYDWQSIPPASTGGVYSGYLFDEHGLEMEQMAEKGLYAAALYNHAATLMNGTVTSATIDRIVAAFGAHPSFPNTDKAASNPDKYAAAYCARRDQNDGLGFYSRFKNGALTAQAAAKAGSDYSNELAAGLANMRDAWERAIMATVINYTYAVVDGLSATSVDDKTRAGAIHAYGECVGFLHGWKAVPQLSRLVTNAQIDALLVLLQAPADGPWTSYAIWQQPVVNLPKVVDARMMLKSIYGFTDTEMESFKTNWVAAQGRQ
ncbi:MAG: hypothetical protein IPH49_14105 [Ignavibacteria bacterium]|nr:hypothetical protein [Ignavibacteria bacterium]